MDDLSDVTPPADELNDERYPSLYNISPAFFYRFIPVPMGERRRPEYVYVDEDSTGLDGLELTGAISQWNLTWEAGHFRKTMMDERFPKVLRDVSGWRTVRRAPGAA